MTLAVGFFDGVHLGHRKILSGADVALTFRNHPLSLLAPERAPRLIMTAEERVAAIGACGVGKVVAIDFTREVAGTEPADFVARFLLPLGGERPKVRCGANWRFGRGGAGDAGFLRDRGIEVEVAPYAEFRGERISSSRIRAALESGDLEGAAAMLGRSFAVSGEVFSGKGEGAGLGFPTLNVRPTALSLRIPRGAYAAALDGAKAVANFGVAPTFGADAWPEPVLEVHCLSRTVSLPPPGSAARVELSRFLRPERKFASAGELRSQIARDCEEALA